MKQVHGNSLILGTAACVFLAAQPVWAQITQITDVQVNPANGGVNVVLKTSSGSRPQIFTTKRGNSLVADVINTQLRLPQGNNFRRENPATGIASVEILQLDANSIRVVVTGSNNAPNSQPVERQQGSITLGFTPSSGTTASTPTPRPTTPIASPAPTPASPGTTPNVLVPNPQVTIDGKPAQPAGPGQPISQAPPFLPRAVAPPVGDIAISTTDASPSTIDLGTQERVPRLVLRDAPVREVLSLLARAAGMNLAYVSTGATEGQAASGQPAAAGKDGQTISLDIENEPVQDVFNHVLRLSGLEANRSGRTIFVGPKLPNATRDTVMRSLRLNQVTVSTALNYLVALGAESAVIQERLITTTKTSTVGEPGDGGSRQSESSSSTESSVQTRRAEFKDSNPLLRGLQALGDERTNSITLIGPPRLIDIAVAQIAPLDIRRRQVAVNVKIIDVNLIGTQDYNTSFSFGVGNNFFTSDGGAASLNFGGVNPPSRIQSTSSLTTPPVIGNPYAGAQGFVDPNNPISVPGTGVGNVVLDNGRIVTNQPGGAASFPRPIDGVSTNPFQTGITRTTQGTPNITTITDIPATPPTFDANGNVISPGTPATREVQTELGTPGSITTALPSLFQFPKRLLLTLQAQVQNGNAKILTDPTLIVQEGQEANVNLTQEVIGRITTRIVDTPGGSREEREPIKEQVGLTMAVKIDRIDDNGFVSLSVSPSISSPQSDVDTGNGRITLVSKRSITSGSIRLRDGQTLILSGVIQDSDRTTVSKLPILGDIPLLGSLFRKTNRSNERREVIVLLTPQIMDDSERSSYGYNYNPSPEVRQMLERRGYRAPGRQ